MVEEERIERASPSPLLNGTMGNKYSPSAQETPLHSHCVVVAEAFDRKAKRITSKAWLDHKVCTESLPMTWTEANFIPQAWKTGVQANLILGILEKRSPLFTFAPTQMKETKGTTIVAPQPTTGLPSFKQMGVDRSGST